MNSEFQASQLYIMRPGLQKGEEVSNVSYPLFYSIHFIELFRQRKVQGNPMTFHMGLCISLLAAMIKYLARRNVREERVILAYS